MMTTIYITGAVVTLLYMLRSNEVNNRLALLTAVGWPVIILLVLIDIILMVITEAGNENSDA